MFVRYLKSHQYYSDLYDRHTVEECREVEKRYQEIKLPTINGKDIPDNDEPRMKKAFSNLHLYFVTGERYKNKEKVIREWIQRDQARDLLYDTAQAPENITCFTCGRIMFVTSKHFNIGWDKKPDRVMFFYDCPIKHVPRRAFYNDGEEFIPKPSLCPKCNFKMDRTNERLEKDKKIVTTETCTGCGHVVTDEIDLTTEENKEIPDPDYEKYKQRFCSEKEGAKYAEWMATAHELTEFLDKQKEKEKNKELYDKVAKIKKLKIFEVEQLLTPILEKADYVKLQLQAPQVGKDVCVPFVVYDAKGDRGEYDSVNELRKLFKNSLEKTNWRLMSDGINHRLGMLEGRIRGYEKEDDIAELFREKEKKVKPGTAKDKDDNEILL